MYRKRSSSILAVRFITSSFVQVSPWLTSSSSSSSRAALLNPTKTSRLFHPRRLLSFNTAAQTFDFSPDPDPNGSLGPSGPGGRSSVNAQQVENGYRIRGPDAFADGGGGSLWQSPSKSDGGSSHGYQRGNLGEFQPPNSDVGYQGNNLGEARKWNSGEVYSKLEWEGSLQQNVNGHRRGNLLGVPPQSSNVGHQRNNIGESPQSNSGFSANGFYGERSGDVGYANKNHAGSFLGSQQNAGALSGGGRADDGYPYENERGFFGENHVEVGQEPDRHYQVNPGQGHQDSHGYQRGNSIPNGHHALSRPQSTVVGDTNTSQNHGGLYGANYRETHQGFSSQYNVNPGQQFQNHYDSQHESNLPFTQQQLNEFPPVSSPETFSKEASPTQLTYEDSLGKLEKLCKMGEVKDITDLLAEFEKFGWVIDRDGYLNLLQACGEAKSLEKAKLIHDQLSKLQVHADVRVYNKILDVYFKCGSTVEASELFEQMPQRNLTTWETMIRGLSNNGYGEEAIDLFTEFKEKGLKPDGGLFNAVFYTCGILGAVDQGMLYFESMKTDFGVIAGIEQYVSIVEMFGRSGYLEEALEFIEKMPIEPNVVVWETLMKFCRVNGYTELGDRCAEIVKQLDPSRVTEQSEKGLLPVVASEITEEKPRDKISDLLDTKRQMIEYKAGDRSHPGDDILYALIRCLAQQMKEMGYIPEIICALHDVDPESREEALLAHSERLAAAHVLLTTPARAQFRIIKNLRVCRDCHNYFKLLSKIVGRLIIARDIKRFHHFENGVCSCNDFW